MERTFGWQDIYRKLAVSYDRLPKIREGGRLLAYAMIHFRVTFNLLGQIPRSLLRLFPRCYCRLHERLSA